MIGGLVNFGVVGLGGLTLAARTQLNYVELVVYGGLLLLGMIALVVVLVICRRRYWSGCDQTPRQIWTLGDLKRMRARGNLNEEEYQRLRGRVLDEMGVKHSENGRGA